MSKIFLDFLKKQDPDELIYVGTKSGSGWIMVDKAAAIIKSLDDLDKSLKAQVQTTYLRAKMLTDVLPTRIVNAQNELGVLTEDDDADEDKLRVVNDKLKNAETGYVSAISTRNKLKKAMYEWETVGNRKVVESYRTHEYEQPGIAVIIRGSENGCLWFGDEKEDEIGQEDVP